MMNKGEQATTFFNEPRYVNPYTDLGFFTPLQKLEYEQSLKYYRDLINVVDTAEQKGIKKGRAVVYLKSPTSHDVGLPTKYSISCP